ncbi:alkaline phosphatase family protein [Nakamurella lactea]|uniref:alkaline phosphatase family protein n=1 Tax=Nakamurella lactea TaxID=459515 RepID=UPI0004149C64|nr:nucleotide pyrophosphatase/phosphodiesterase family protein [Nakamurella lactea]
MTSSVPSTKDGVTPLAPGYGAASLGSVLPGAARSLGVDLALPAVELPTAQRICVLLIDGLGERQLAQSELHAPQLTKMHRRVMHAGCPTTTATSMGSFGTGLPPGRHGLTGYVVLDPDRGELFNELTWHADTDPLVWQPYPPVFEQLAEAGVASLAIGNPEFADSGLTRAAHRGAEFMGVRRLHRRVDTAVAALTDPNGPTLVYLYWGEVDAAGHRRGWQSPQWRRALRYADREIGRLAAKLPAGTLLLVTADHGMVDAAALDRVDLAERDDLSVGVRLVGGEPRFAQLYCEPGAGAEVAGRLATELGDRAWVVTRDEAERAGWFGPVDDRVRRRIGDVLVAGRQRFTLVDSRFMTAPERALVGYHGSLTPDEQEIPLAIELL